LKIHEVKINLIGSILVQDKLYSKVLSYEDQKKDIGRTGSLNK